MRLVVFSFFFNKSCIRKGNEDECHPSCFDKWYTAGEGVAGSLQLSSICNFGVQIDWNKLLLHRRRITKQ